MNSPIDFNDLARIHDPLRKDFVEVLNKAINSNDFILGDTVANFEHEFSEMCRVPGSVGVGSGTDALILVLRGLGIGPGDAVIVPALTFAATAEAVVHVGARPIFVDVDPDTLLIDPNSVDDNMNASVRCIIPVHLYGHLVPLEHIRSWAAKIFVIEDAAQAHLGRWNENYIGSASHAATFSFYPGKNLGALGDGGAIISTNSQLLNTIRMLRNHGGLTKYEHSMIGTTSRLDALQAAFLTIKLAHLPEWTFRRNTLAELYKQRLSAISGVKLVPWSEGSVHHLFVIRLNSEIRSQVQQVLAAENIGTGIHYPQALTQLEAFAKYIGKCPVAEQAASEVLSLPLHPCLTEREIEIVCECLKSAL